MNFNNFLEHLFIKHLRTTTSELCFSIVFCVKNWSKVKLKFDCVYIIISKNSLCVNMFKNIVNPCLIIWKVVLFIQNNGEAVFFFIIVLKFIVSIFFIIAKAEFVLEIFLWSFFSDNYNSFVSILEDHFRKNWFPRYFAKFQWKHELTSALVLFE